MFSVASTLILLLFNLQGFAQEPEIQAKFIIQDFRFNKADYSEHMVKNKCYLAIYTVKGDKRVYFANVNPTENTESYGDIFSLTDETIQGTDSTYKQEIYHFKWSYVNSYDKRKGTSTIRLVKIMKDAGIAFECTIIPENLDVLTYKGYMEGTLKSLED